MLARFCLPGTTTERSNTMAAAPIHGKSGSITFAGLTLGIKEWSFDYTSDTADSTDFVAAAAGYRTFLPGIAQATGTVKANWDTANTVVPNAAAASLTLTVSGTANYSGSAILTGLKVTQGYGGIVEVDYNF